MINYYKLIHFIGFKYLQPPPLPSNHVHRHSLLHEIATKLLQATNDPNKYETTLTITGAGGFGKTNIVTSLCYHSLVKEQFTDGFIFIELGPQATDPNVKLVQLYHLLTGENLKYSDINHAEKEIKKFTNDYYLSVLVIIDDVWHVEDAEPLVKAFSSCKTILTTRMNDVEKYLPSIQSITIGPMAKNEALSLITKGVINSRQLSLEDKKLLNELAQDVHLWPLLLSLVRGQLFHYIKHYHLSYHEAIQNVQRKLYNKGLTAFDKNIESINKGRKLAVEACIEMTLELLPKPLSDKIKIFILYNGIGVSLQTAVLHNLWDISKQEAEDVVDTLWAYGLAHTIDNAASPKFNSKPCLEIHADISQYIIERMDYTDVLTLDPFCNKLNIRQAVRKAMILVFQESYGVHNMSSLNAKEFLEYKKCEIENITLPEFIRVINEQTITDPHFMAAYLQDIHNVLEGLSPFTLNFMGISLKELNSLIAECKRTSRSTHILCRKLNQSVQRILYEKKYDKLIPAIQEFVKIYPLFNVAQKTITIANKITPYCEDILQHIVKEVIEYVHLFIPQYHYISTSTIPLCKVHIEHHKQITSALMNGSLHIELTYNYFISNKASEDINLVNANQVIKQQEIAPNIVKKLHSKSYYQLQCSIANK